MKIIKYLLSISFLFIVGCSATKETEEDTSKAIQSVYVFDDVLTLDTLSAVTEKVPKDTITTLIQETPTAIVELFIVQIGAFTTLEKAEVFMLSFKDETIYELNIHFSPIVNLHVVQLTPFRTRDEAEKVRDELRTIPELEGTFIVPNKNLINEED